MHYLSSVYFISQPLHVSSIFVAHHQEVYCIYRCCAFQLTVCWLAKRQATEKHNMYQLLYIYSIPPDEGLHICAKRVEVDWWNKLKINCALGWFLLHRCIEMHSQQNIKLFVLVYSFRKQMHVSLQKQELQFFLWQKLKRAQKQLVSQTELKLSTFWRQDRYAHQ